MNFEEELIELVKDQPALYKKSHANYKNVFMKEKIWRAISAQIVGVSVEKLKKRWKTLRNTFRIEISKRNLPSWKIERKETKWKYFKLMTFLIEDYEEYSPNNSFTFDDISGDIPVEVNVDSTAFGESKSSFLLSPAQSGKDSLSSANNSKINIDVMGTQKKYKELLKTAATSSKENTRKDEIFLFMDSMATKIHNANLSCDDMDDIQELILIYVNKKLRDIRNNKNKE